MAGKTISVDRRNLSSRKLKQLELQKSWIQALLKTAWVAEDEREGEGGSGGVDPDPRRLYLVVTYEELTDVALVKKN